MTALGLRCRRTTVALHGEVRCAYRLISGETKEVIHVLPPDLREREPIRDFSIIKEILEETELERLERKLKLQNLLESLKLLHLFPVSTSWTEVSD